MALPRTTVVLAVTAAVAFPPGAVPAPLPGTAPSYTRPRDDAARVPRVRPGEAVVISAGGGAPWARMTPSQEELWPLLAPVAPTRPGGRVRVALGPDAAGLVGDEITSPAFGGRVVLRETAAHARWQARRPASARPVPVYAAEVTVRCGTAPGMYPVYFSGGAADAPYRFETQLTVMPAGADSPSPCGS
ncbi:hypothetical protein ABZ832_25605 [Streptantibioticus parmotrematis]|uniref:hypothetical protein n=1 Tax=Streptantibioticus parmotrematis TaxID=2873249 RepID=UPI00340FF53E